MAKTRAVVSWSSGKDSAWALHMLREENEYEVVGLVTTINETAARVAMHAVRESLLEAQAAVVELPLWRVPIPSPCSNEQYEAAMRRVLQRARAADVRAFAFGDLFLTDIRAYREKQLTGSGVTPLFPLWMRATGALAREMLDHGLRAVLTCVDPRQLAPEFAGHEFNVELLQALPAGVDPCGENGEFHTFVYAGPMFHHSIPVAVGDVIERDGFAFADVARC
ncbi:MAG: ATP-binding protein [Candidatus Binatia bacterium]